MGNSEVDDPTVTQPRRAMRIIKDRAPLYQIYAERIGVDATAEVQQVQAELLDDQKTATKAGRRKRLAELPDYWDPFHGGELRPEDEVVTGLPAAKIGELVKLTTHSPDGFHVHPKVKKLFEQREEMGAGAKPFDYGTAELVAFASLLEAGVPVRLTGQDLAAWDVEPAACGDGGDVETEQRYNPLTHIGAKQGKFELYNSLL